MERSGPSPGRVLLLQVRSRLDEGIDLRGWKQPGWQKPYDPTTDWMDCSALQEVRPPGPQVLSLK